jgi:hypothetical protein
MKWEHAEGKLALRITEKTAVQFRIPTATEARTWAKTYSLYIEANQVLVGAKQALALGSSLSYKDSFERICELVEEIDRAGRLIKGQAARMVEWAEEAGRQTALLAFNSADVNDLVLLADELIEAAMKNQAEPPKEQKTAEA